MPVSGIVSQAGIGAIPYDIALARRRRWKEEGIEEGRKIAQAEIEQARIEAERAYAEIEQARAEAERARTVGLAKFRYAFLCEQINARACRP